jgi:dihydroorotate dehydrogenase (fumarate)
MTGLSTSYMGLNLRNPIVVGSSDLTGSVESVMRCEDAGAGAVVLKSLFSPETVPTKWAGQSSADGVGTHLDPQAYARMVSESKSRTAVPLIASLHGTLIGNVTRHAKVIRDSGADALELNLSVIPDITTAFSGDIEEYYRDLMERTAGSVGIPVSVKLHPFITSMKRTVYGLAGSNASAIVLFNRHFQIDIDIERQTITEGPPLSSPEEMHHALRWIAILHDTVPCDLAACTGVYSASDALKLLLVGAKTVQVSSTLYRHGLQKIGQIANGIETWMERQGYDRLDDFRGKLSQTHSREGDAYEVLQHVGPISEDAGSAPP